METSWVLYSVAVAISCMCDNSRGQAPPEVCSPPCGFQAVCKNSSCSCPAPFILHENGKDCRNEDSCSSTDCLKCDTPDRCIRCENFISVSTGLCLKKCEGSAEIKGDNLTCTESKNDEGRVDIVVAVVSGVAAGAALCIIVIIAACFYIRRTRRNINLQNKDYNRKMEGGYVKQFPAYENNAYETDGQTVYKSSKIDPLEYANALDKLRPHADTLMALLTQVRSKTRAMDASDERVPTYKGVIHQLCRVLVLVHKRDPVVSIPSDAMGLIQWAHQLLDDHREQQNSSGGDSAELPIAQISSVDFDFHNHLNPVYATPDRSQVHDSTSASLQDVATPYSTVPVPLSETEQQQHYGTGKRPGFATISRARAKPYSDLIRALEADLNGSEPYTVPQDLAPVSHYQNSGIRREEFQNFLIQNGEKSEIRNAFHRNVENALQTSDNPITAYNYSSGGGQSLSSELKEKITNRLNNSELKSPLSVSSQIFQTDKVAENCSIGSQQSVKKNIITNPNTIKKPSSMAGKDIKYAIPNTGYFANGRYYDPNPMPNPEAEVYAPGSNYSDRSNVMSTFLGDLPRSRSASASEQSEDGDNDSENSGGDLDVFPFDPKDCTDPVEV